MPADPTPAEILALPVGPEGQWRSTVHGYLTKFGVLLRVAGPDSRPFGQSGWRGDIEKAFIDAHWVHGTVELDGYVSDVDEDAVDRLVRSAIAELGCAA